MPPFTFVGSSAKARSTNVQDVRALNLYAEIEETQRGRSLLSLYGTPGLSLFATLPTGPVRGMYTNSDGRVFAVGGTGVYEVYADGSTPLLGSLLTHTGPVSMVDNGFQLAIVDGPYGYSVDLASNVVTQIISDSFYGADRVTFLDGYFVFNKPNTQQFYISGLNDITFSGLDFASSQGYADWLVTLIADHRELWLFGMTTTEVWYNVGAVTFPFAPVQGAFLETGCIAPQSIAKLDNSIFWLDGDERGYGLIWRNNGYQPVRVSTHAVEFALSQYPSLSDAVAYTYEQEGHIFYVLNFPSAGKTWAYDVATQLWHERAYRDTTTGILGQDRAICHAFAYNLHLVGDYRNGNVYALNLDDYTHNGAVIRRELIFPAIFGAENEFLYHNLFQVIMETGIGLDGGVIPGSMPQAMLSWSNDGGHSWSNEHWKSAGKIGETTYRVIWRRLGRARARYYKWAFSDPCKMALQLAQIDFDDGEA